MQYKIAFDCISLNRKQSRKISKNSQILHRNFKFLVKIEIYVTGAETVPVNTFYYIKDIFLMRCTNWKKLEFDLKRLSEYAPPNNSSPPLQHLKFYCCFTFIIQMA